jgi:Ca2+-binding RTX toxin-like protein
MERRLGPGWFAIAIGTLTAGTVLFAGAANAGSLFQGCDEAAGTIFMDGDSGDTDDFVAGYKAGTKSVRVEGTRETPSGTIMSVITCQSSNWKSFSSNLRDKADRVRADAVGMSVSGYTALPSSMKATLKGGTGADRIVGHPGIDEINGGSSQDILSAREGNDVIHAADGVADTVYCGPGHDKAEVDPQDTRTGCENVIVFVRHSP